MMLCGMKYSLAVPVLANIYKSLNEIKSSAIPGKCDTAFIAHYLNAWLAEYFNTHFDWPHVSPALHMVRFFVEGATTSFEEAEARKLFRFDTGLEFHMLALSKKEQVVLEDNDQLSNFYRDYLINQRSNYLASRRDNLSVLEPYSPHRFGRQFGFNLDI